MRDLKIVAAFVGVAALLSVSTLALAQGVPTGIPGVTGVPVAPSVPSVPSTPSLGQGAAAAAAAQQAAQGAGDQDPAAPAPKKKAKKKRVKKMAKNANPKAGPGQVLVANEHAAGLKQLVLTSTSDPKKTSTMAVGLPAGAKIVGKLPAKGGCVYTIEGEFDDGTSLSADNVEVCRDRALNLTE